MSKMGMGSNISQTTYDARFRESAPLYIVHLHCIIGKIMYSNIFYGIVLTKLRISVSPKPGMV